jgi:DNA-binding NarL/FixJ family response regulator
MTLPGDTPGVIPRVRKITPLEQWIMRMLCEGWDYQRIADERRVSYESVKNMSHRVFAKIGVVGANRAVILWSCEIFQVGLRELDLLE